MTVLLALVGIPFATRTYYPIFHFLRRLPLRSFYSTAVQFPSPTIIILLLASILLLQPRRRPTVIYFLVALLCSSMINETIKYTVARARPGYSIQMDEDTKAWILSYKQTHPASAMRAERKDQWLGLTGGQPRFKDGYASFPSGHSNSSFVLATYLSALYPQGRLLWYLAAGGTGLARVAKGRHWPEDVLFGGALGWLVTRIVFSWRWPGRLGLWVLGDGRRRPGWRRSAKGIRGTGDHDASDGNVEHLG
jgi:membrane-associated phospholipid phosphatase